MSEDAAHPYLGEKITRMHPDVSIALAFAPPERVDLLRCLLTLKSDLEALMFGSREHEVLFNRMQWWRDEWSRLVDGVPRHPLTTALAAQGRFVAGRLDPALMGILEHDPEDCPDTAALAAPAAALAETIGGIEADALGSGGDARSLVWRDLIQADLVLELPRRLGQGVAVIPLGISAELQVTRAQALNDPAAMRLVQGRLRSELDPVATRPASRGDAWVLRTLLLQRLASVADRGREPGPVRRLRAGWAAARVVRRARGCG